MRHDARRPRPHRNSATPGIWHSGLRLALRNQICGICPKAIRTALAVSPATEKYYARGLVDTHPSRVAPAAAEVLAEVRRRLAVCTRVAETRP
jgi:hypothetical protein